MLQTSIHKHSENLAMFLQLIIVNATAKTTSVNEHLSKKVTWSECNVKTAADDTACKSFGRLIDKLKFDVPFPTNFMYSGCF